MQVNDNLNLDLSDDEELRDQLDMHSIIVSCINEEPLFTAEQVKFKNKFVQFSVKHFFFQICLECPETA